MSKDSEYGTKMRLLMIMRDLLDRPMFFTKKMLFEKYDVTRETISNDFNVFRNSGFMLRVDSKYRYAFVEDNTYKELKSLLHFSEEDQVLLEQAIDQIAPHTKRGEKLKQKLGSLYDYHRLGHSYLRKPYLKKVNILLQGQREKKVVKLIQYRSSNSDKISDRFVEPFHINPGDDMLHSLDVEKKELRHFRISRFSRAELLEDDWQYEGKHNIIATDPFRIVDNKQVMVHLRLRVGAYNELTERYPLTMNCIQDGEIAGTFDFQGKVNHRFRGLSNFILGNYHFLVEVLEPESLLEHLKATVNKMNF